MSRKPGIGCNYIDSHKQWHLDGQRNFTKVNGILGALPRYYKERIFDEDQRAAISAIAVELGRESVREELRRLHTLHHDPYLHYSERVRYAHDSIKSKTDVHLKQTF